MQLAKFKTVDGDRIAVPPSHFVAEEVTTSDKSVAVYLVSVASQNPRRYHVDVKYDTAVKKLNEALKK